MKWAATAATYPNKSKVLKPSGLFFVSLKYDVPSLGPAARNTTIPIASAKIPGKSRRMVESFIGTAFYMVKNKKIQRKKHCITYQFPFQLFSAQNKAPSKRGRFAEYSQKLFFSPMVTSKNRYHTLGSYCGA